MSYSFSVKAADKAEAMKLLGEEFDRVIAAQPTHKHDREAALAAAVAFIDLIEAPDAGRKLAVSLHGSLSWASNDPEKFYGAAVGVSAHYE